MVTSNGIRNFVRNEEEGSQNQNYQGPEMTTYTIQVPATAIQVPATAIQVPEDLRMRIVEDFIAERIDKAHAKLNILKEMSSRDFPKEGRVQSDMKAWLHVQKLMEDKATINSEDLSDHLN